MNLAIRYTWNKADVQVASLMHDYMELPLTETWVDNANKVIKLQRYEVYR